MPGTDNSCRRSRSLRDVSFSRTRIGIWRLSRLNFARLVSTSPLVAMRVTRLNVSVVTPSSAARSGSGRITISGFCNAALLVIMPSPGIGADLALDVRRRETQPIRLVAGQRDLEPAAAAAAAELKPRAGNVAQHLGGLALEDLLRAARAVGVVELDHERPAAHVARTSRRPSGHRRRPDAPTVV